ncbi:TonB-dependent receptor plug domain-containing protein [Aquabacterium sp.]|uniref:TonB-dependent receptor plug domain-containing protein n=1 Tax=Aquabacterium sp. TaxID=1872578 RepID=UPI0037834AD4
MPLLPARPLLLLGLSCCVPASRAADAPPPPAAASAPVRAASAAAPARPASAPAARPQQVEIIGNTQPESNAERRRSTASRIIVGREELDRMGDGTLGEVLKRLPGVTMGGPPGRGSAPRMRGLGGGYTQILIDGQRMPFGFSLDSIAPEQIERIEIMRAPVAEHGARAIAGTINVIMREDFKRMANEFKFGGGLEQSRRPQAGLNWIYSGQTERLGYNLTATVFRQDLGNEVSTHVHGADAQGNTTLEQFTRSRGDDRRESLFLSSRLQFRLGPGHTLDLQPFLSSTRVRGLRDSTLDQPINLGRDGDAPYDHAHSRSETQTRMARLNGTWIVPTGSGGRFQLRFGSMLAFNDSVTRRLEFNQADEVIRTRHDDGSQRDLSIDTSGKFSQLLGESHSVSAGWELQRGQRNDQRRSLTNGVPILTDFGDNLEATTLRVAAYAQDEWEWSKRFSFYAGLRWEGIQTRSDSMDEPVRNKSSVLTPLLHAVWRLPDAPRDQLRFSLTRSYRAPNTSQLIARPSISTLYPDLAKGNQPTSPDRAGNPDLKPELAWGTDLAFEHYLEAGGLLSANLFARRIDNLIRTVRALETVGYATAPRWVARPQNIGGATAAGLELEAKLRAADLWTTDLPLTLRTNASLLWSRVDGVPGPNNRLDQQPRYTLNLGADWPVRGTPLTIGGNLNFTPSFVIQQIDSQVYRQGVKRQLDAYALWRFGTMASLRLSITNLSARDFDSASTTFLADGSSQTQDTLTRSYTVANLRCELRF